MCDSMNRRSRKGLGIAECSQRTSINGSGVSVVLGAIRVPVLHISAAFGGGLINARFSAF